MNQQKAPYDILDTHERFFLVFVYGEQLYMSQNIDDNADDPDDENHDSGRRIELKDVVAPQDERGEDDRNGCVQQTDYNRGFPPKFDRDGLIIGLPVCRDVF